MKRLGRIAGLVKAVSATKKQRSDGRCFNSPIRQSPAAPFSPIILSGENLFQPRRKLAFGHGSDDLVHYLAIAEEQQ